MLNKKLSIKTIHVFQEVIWSYYKEHGRSFSWRQTEDPYHILVSEIMLQQTQTYRVEKKFDDFIKQFPTLQVLAQASLRDVLAAWQGLGYNRRALSLHKTAQKIIKDYNGIVPNNPEILVTFSGIGKATAASICAFAFNMPTIFIETNIRSVFLHFFFPNVSKVHDNCLYPLVQQTLDKANPRHWYYALMDYGVMLKKSGINPSLRSAHYVKQSTFEGSDRQIRGLILKILTHKGMISTQELLLELNRDEERVKRIIYDLIHEGFVACHHENLIMR